MHMGDGYLGQTAPPAANGAASDYPILSLIAQLAPAIGNAIGQVKLIDLNSELIKQGKPPLTAAQAQAVSPRIDVGMSADTQNTLLWIAAGAGVIALLWMLSSSSARA